MSALVLFPDGIPGRAQPVSRECFGIAHSGAEKNAWEQHRYGGWPCMVRPDTSLPGPLYLCGVCTSSLDMANIFARQRMLPVWGSVLAYAQTAGRGQLGRSWHSAPGNLFAALRLPLAPPFNGSAAALALGAYLAAGLRELDCPIRFKWPNDLVIVEDGHARKVCGILLEERNGALLAGIGINLVTPPPPEALREGHALPGGCLSIPSMSGPLPLWRQLVTRIKFCYEQELSAHAAGSPGSVSDHWRHLAETLLLYKTNPVAVLDGPENRVVVRGSLVGLAPDGGLCIRTRDGLHIVHSGSLIRE